MLSLGPGESAENNVRLTTQPDDEEKKAKDLKEYIKANYTKHEFLIPMRDGVRLFTSVYTPKSKASSFRS